MKLETLFLRYSSESDDVAAAYKQCKAMIKKAIAGEITEVTTERLPGGYFTSHFEVIEFSDLYKAAADFDMYLEGWESEEKFNAHMEGVMKQAEQEYSELLDKNT